jgi:hypothetical protein
MALYPLEELRLAIENLLADPIPGKFLVLPERSDAQAGEVSRLALSQESISGDEVQDVG